MVIIVSAIEQLILPHIEASLAFVKFKSEAAVAGGNGGAASYFHPMSVAPVLGTAIGCANVEVGKFFFHVSILLFRRL